MTFFLKYAETRARRMFLNVKRWKMELKQIKISHHINRVVDVMLRLTNET